MKASVYKVSELSSSSVQMRSFWRDLLDLTKARLTFLVLLTTFSGFYIAGGRSISLAFHLLFGTACVASSAAVLNQLIEKKWDAKMHRTANRPIASGRISDSTALWIGFCLGLGGLYYLYAAVNSLAALLAGITLGSYIYIYTPLKRVTHLNTLVGAVPGAIPPLIGWAAAQSHLSIEAWILWAILFCWQMPHFLAIGYLYEEEYRAAGFRMLASEDLEGKMSGRQALLYSVTLLPFTFLFLKTESLLILILALIITLWLIKRAFDFYRYPGKNSARKLFLASIFYLPLLLAIFCWASS